jgi:geranylgeranyl pyrophosphate synthase/predicted secreted hydrolase
MPTKPHKSPSKPPAPAVNPVPPVADRKRDRQAWELRSPTSGPVDAPDMSQWRDYYPAPTGDFDLMTYEQPMPRCMLEWWYLNTHVTSKKNGQRFSLFASFFAQADKSSLTEEEVLAKKPYDFFHACTWAIADVDKQKYMADCLLDHRSCDRLITKLDPKITGVPTRHAETALLELVKKGRVPLPDRLMKKGAKVTATKESVTLDLDGDCIFTVRAAKNASEKSNIVGAPEVVYELSLHNPHRNIKAKLTFVPQRRVTRHGLHGIVNEMFYYYIPRMAVTGTIDFNGDIHEVSGSGWYDREFGGSHDETGKDALDAWTWFSCQLSNDSELSFYNVVDRDNNREKEKVAVFTNAAGVRTAVTDVTLSYSNMWTSLNTYIEYPQQWKLSSPSLGLDLYLNCTFQHQEFMTIIVTGGGFWEGRVHINGSHHGKEITGTGFLERKNHIPYKDTNGLLKNVGRIVKKTLSDLYPLKASQEWIDKNVLGRHAAPGSDPDRICETIFAPVRALIDRGGKSWRSLILVSSVNALSVDYRDCSKYIAISELLHVGSLIIDDIQDESSVRRGGKTIHLEYGTATAINAGTMCYFMAPLLAGIDELDEDQRLAIYDLYFDCLRAGHAGQGLDIAGLDRFMPEVVETGNTTKVLAALRAIHIYKTGGAAGSLCRMGCVIARANEKAANALENFGTQIGLAFQIVDDALNLRGFEGDLKEVGEDIRDGKVTYPVIKAMERLDKSDRIYVWTILQEKTADMGKISSVISKLNSVCAIDDCLVEARNLVEDAWEPVDAALPDTLPKIMMRTFCAYLTERTY